MFIIQDFKYTNFCLFIQIYSLLFLNLFRQIINRVQVSRQLGARTVDISGLLNIDGTVSPKLFGGGMSTSTNRVFAGPILNNIYNHKVVIFKILKSEVLASGLNIDYDRPGHAAIQPGNNMTTEQFQEKLESTQKLWIKDSRETP